MHEITEFMVDEHQVPVLIEDTSSGMGPEALTVFKQVWKIYQHFGEPISREGLSRRFLNLQASWKREKQFTSSSTEIVLNSNYQRIIGMGRSAVPLILESLWLEPDHWFHALYSITGENPVPPEDRGDIQAMTQAWLDWGRSRGFIS